MSLAHWDTTQDVHLTPWGKEQAFQYTRFRRR